MAQAEEGLRELKSAVDTLITIPNQRLLSVTSRATPLKESFQKADDVLLQAVRGISELVTVHGLINLDFADVRSIMAEMGMAMMGAATASGENRAVEAAQRAISSPLLEDVSIKGARGRKYYLRRRHRRRDVGRDPRHCHRDRLRRPRPRYAALLALGRASDHA